MGKLDRLELIVPLEEAGQRADRWISTQVQLSRSAVQKLCTEGFILSNGKPIGKNQRIQAGEKLEISLPDPVLLDAVPQNIPVEIV